MMKQKYLDQCGTHAHGIDIHDIRDKINTNLKSNSIILIIPPGIGTVNMRHFVNMKKDESTYSIHFTDGIHDTDVDDDQSFTSLLDTITRVKPTLIVAGSRGTTLMTRLLTLIPSAYEGGVLLLGPVHLRPLMETIETRSIRKLVIVHGVHDFNERIDTVRRVVATSSAPVTLIEATTAGHNMAFEHVETLHNVVEYCLC